MKLLVVSKDAGVVRLLFEGDLTPDGGSHGPNPLENAVGMGCYGQKVIVNMEKAAFINSAGVGWLVGLHKNFEKAGGRMVLYSIPPMINNVLQLLKMNKFLHCAKDEDAALKLLAGTNP